MKWISNQPSLNKENTLFTPAIQTKKVARLNKFSTLPYNKAHGLLNLWKKQWTKWKDCKKLFGWLQKYVGEL